MIRSLNKKDLTNFLSFCSQKDRYSDCYITRNNKRLFLNDQKVCSKVFSNCLKHGDKCLIKEDQEEIKGILLVTGYADQYPRKFIKILAQDNQTIDDLLKSLTWTHNTDLYIKIKRDNPIQQIATGNKKDFRGFGFRFQGSRGKEILLYRKYNEKFDYNKRPKFIKEEDRE